MIPVPPANGPSLCAIWIQRERLVEERACSRVILSEGREGVSGGPQYEGIVRIVLQRSPAKLHSERFIHARGTPALLSAHAMAICREGGRRGVRRLEFERARQQAQ